MSQTRKIFLFIGLPLLVTFGTIIAYGLTKTNNTTTTSQLEERKNSGETKEGGRPVLYNLGGVLLAKYDDTTGMAGDIKFTKDGLDTSRGHDTHFYLFGQKLPKNSESEPQRINPNFEFGGIAKQIDIISAIDGVVVNIQQQTGSSDYEVFLSNTENGSWVIGYDHLVDLKVKKGDRVTVGQKLGLVAKQNSGDYRYELQVNDEDNKLMYCPVELLETSIRSTAAAQITQLVSDWTDWYGKDVFGAHTGGCIKPSITVAESEGS